MPEPIARLLAQAAADGVRVRCGKQGMTLVGSPAGLADWTDRLRARRDEVVEHLARRRTGTALWSDYSGAEPRRWVE